MADDMNTEPVPPAPTEEQLGPAEQDLIQWLFERFKRPQVDATRDQPRALAQAQAIGDP